MKEPAERLVRCLENSKVQNLRSQLRRTPVPFFRWALTLQNVNHLLFADTGEGITLWGLVVGRVHFQYRRCRSIYFLLARSEVINYAWLTRVSQPGVRTGVSGKKKQALFKLLPSRQWQWYPVLSNGEAALSDHSFPGVASGLGFENESESVSHLRPHGLQPTRLLCPWDSWSKWTLVDCHNLLQGNLPGPGVEPRSPALQAESLHLSHQDWGLKSSSS